MSCLRRVAYSTRPGTPNAARPLFEEAFGLASAAGLEHLAVDSLHMVAIVAPADQQAELNEQALALASAATDPRAREWRASLLNNLGWTRFDGGDYAAALALFEDAVTERERLGKARELQIARWCVGRTLRALGRTEEALELQLSLADKSSRTWVSDSFVEEEIGECLVELGRADEARAHFAVAANLLEAAGAGEQPDPERLARLRAASATAGDEPIKATRLPIPPAADPLSDPSQHGAWSRRERASEGLEQPGQQLAIGPRVRQQEQRHVGATVTFALVHVSDEALHVPDPRLGLDADQLPRQPQKQIPRTTIANVRQRRFRQDPEGRRQDRAQPCDERLVALVAQRLPYRKQPDAQLQPKHRRDHRDVCY